MEPTKSQMLVDSFINAGDSYREMKKHLDIFQNICKTLGGGHQHPKLIEALETLDFMFAAAKDIE